MVESNLAYKFQEFENEIDYTFLPDKLKHTSVSLGDILNNSFRLEASAFSIDAKLANEKIKKNKNGYSYAWSEKGFIKDCFYGGRAKRNYVYKNTEGSVGFLGSAEMLNLYPDPVKFLSSNVVDIEPFKVEPGTILISRSGTIGKVTFVNKTLSQNLVSEHAIRIVAKKYSGYLYSFFQTDIGRTLVQSNVFGAVVDQIEPQHFEKIIIPKAPDAEQRLIHDLIVDSYELRDKSNDLVDEAKEILYQELNLKNVEDIKSTYFDESIEIRNFTTKLSDLKLRLDSSFHIPIIQEVEKLWQAEAGELVLLSDKSITREIILPGRFSRTYVNEENGIQFLGGRDLFQLNPTTEKYLSRTVHRKQLEGDLKIFKNDILTPSRGTIGKVVLAPEHFGNKAISDNIIKIRPANDEIAGYLFTLLNSDYGRILIKRQIYGGVVDALEPNMMGSIRIPLLKNKEKQKAINDLVLKANALRFEAYQKEVDAIRNMNNIIYQI